MFASQTVTSPKKLIFYIDIITIGFVAQLFVVVFEMKTLGIFLQTADCITQVALTLKIAN